LTNVQPHLQQAFVFTTDISNFYPSVHRQRVFDLFTELGCSQEVASYCTRLCTHEHRLAQGLITSPILADMLLRPVDEGIGMLCRQNKLAYTRFVDDLAISGRFDLEQACIPDVIHQILTGNGFAINEDKKRFGKVAEGFSITGIRFNKGHPDVERAYLDSVLCQLTDHQTLAEGGDFKGTYQTEAQMRGKVSHICWINPGRRRSLHSRLSRIDWKKTRAEAQRRGLEVLVRRVVRQTTS
jgi:hypothetical protein